jgi:uncharacterized protein
MADGTSRPAPAAAHIQDLIAARLSRRGMVAAGLAGLPLLTLAGESAAAKPKAGKAAAAKLGAEPGRPLTFASVPETLADQVTVPTGYKVQTLIGWGDALFADIDAAPDLNPTRESQERRFGQNNDMLAIFPAAWTFPKARDQKQFLLCANHEYFDASLMFPAIKDPKEFGEPHMKALFASMGVSVVAIAQDGDDWRVIKDAKPGAGKNSRITPFTPVVFTGPATNHPWITAAGAVVNKLEPGAPAGQIACGTLANCAGGETPWGTYLTAEENFNSFFFNTAEDFDLNDPRRLSAQALDASVMGYPFTERARAFRTLAQFDIAGNPTGPALYGWTVEIDPYDPSWAPRKRTALGRRKGECATTALCPRGRVVVYAGDDQVDEFVYKFVSAGRFNPADRLANRDLLDTGQLYAARFDEDGKGRWLALTLPAANAAAEAAGYPHPFTDAGDLVVRAREAARLLGATPMDRPEDVEAPITENWVGTGTVLVVCTNNRQQGFERPANPRRDDPARPGRAQANMTGHIVRIEETGQDCAATTFSWDIFALAGDPKAGNAPVVTGSGAKALVGVDVQSQPSFSGDRFACPDNICFDTGGHVWIATDGSDDIFDGCNDMIVVTAVDAPAPRPVKRFLVGPMGSEICGPMLSPDEKSFFAAIQHPGENNAKGLRYSDLRWKGEAPPSTFPDGSWPRSAVVVVRKDDGGVIGS